jgi:ABC-type tungstate transport system substrate-binding protein
MIALSPKNVFINGVQYVKNGNFESEGPLDKSNLYVLKATMLKQELFIMPIVLRVMILILEVLNTRINQTEIGF